MKSLSIQTSRPRLDITTTHAKINIKNNFRRFQAKRTAPQMKVDRKAPSMQVNWNKVWAESGRKKPDKLMQHIRQRSRQQVAAATQKIAQNGDYVLQLQNYRNTSRNPIGEIAWDEMYSNLPEINVSMMPESMPEVYWDPGHIKIEWTTGELQLEWDEQFMPDVTVTPHSVEIKLKGQSKVDISVNEERVSKTNGKKISKMI